MRALHSAVIAGLMLGSMSGAAKAATYSVNYTGAIGFPDTLSIDFSTDGSTFDNGYYFLKVLSAIVNGESASIYDYINAFYNPASTYVDFVLLIKDGPLLVDLQLKGYSNAAEVRIFEAGSGFGTFTISAVPLPASAPLFGAAVLGLAGMAYASKRKVAAGGNNSSQRP